MQLQSRKPLNIGLKRGYTLVEIMVALTIVGLIFGVGYVAFREFAQRQALASVARGLQGDLRLAQEQALSGKKPSGCTGDLAGYAFRILTDSYQIEAQCGTGSVEVKTVPLPAAITLSTPSVNPILFKVLGKGTNIPSGELEISILGFGQTLSVLVSSGGGIE